MPRRLLASLGLATWLLLGTFAAGGGEAVEIADLLSDEADPSDRVQYFREGWDLNEVGDCELTQLFWGRVDPWESQEMSLGLFLLERDVDGRRLGADVLSVLVRHSDMKVWLRAGPTEDTGWIEVGAATSSSVRWSPFRSCFAEVIKPGEDFWTEPCERAECESRFFLRPRIRSGNAAIDLVLGEEAEDGPFVELEAGYSALRRSTTGRRGISRWLIDNQISLGLFQGGDLSTEDETTRRRDLVRRLEFDVPASSQAVWRAVTLLADRPLPSEEFAFLPRPFGLGEGPTSVVAGRPVQRLLRGLNFETGDSAPEACVKLFGPRASPNDLSFDWAWTGLGNAYVSGLGRDTDDDGCFRPSVPGKFFKVKLKNPHIKVRSLLEPWQSVRVGIFPSGPFVFVDPGNRFYETLVATNAFVWSNEGLVDFNRVFPWMRDRVRNLEIVQNLHPEVSCAAYRIPGRLHLPFGCPGIEGFIAKGLCGDVVLHELTHEMMGSLVGLATADRDRTVRDAVLNEALADFFAMGLRRGPGQDQLVYGKSCQNDFREIAAGGGHLGQDNLLMALRDPGDFLLRGRLASFAVLYGWQSQEHFFATLFDFAADKARIDESVLGGICRSVKEQTGYCDSQCAKFNYCAQITSADREGEALAVRGVFEETENCPNYSIERRLDGGPAQPARLQQRASGLPREPGLLGLLELPENLKAPFEVLFKPECKPGAELESETLRIEGLPSLPPLLTNFEIAGLGKGDPPGDDDGGPWLVTVSDSGLLSAITGSGSDEIVLEEERLWPGFSTAGDGTVAGWTTTGQQITVQLHPKEGAWSFIPGDRGNLPRRSRHPRLGAGLPLALVDPRLEILDFDAFGATVAWWGGEKPTIRRRVWRREIDPGSLAVGLSSKGAVLSVEERLPPTQVDYRFVDGQLEVVKKGWAAFPVETPGVSIRRHGEKNVHIEIEIEESLCKAPPFLRFAEGLLLALTCDGVATAIALEVEEPTRVWTAYAPGIVAPDPAIEPIQRGDLDGDGSDEWIFGPFRRREDGRSVDRVVALRADGEPFDRDRPIVTQRESAGPPVVLDIDGDGCEEVALGTGKSVELWDLGGPCAANQ